MLDLELLRSFVSVVDFGGFTPPANASTGPVDREPADQAAGRRCRPAAVKSHRQRRDADKEAGERLLSYARRLLALTEEARDVMAHPGSEDGAVNSGADCPGLCRLSPR